MTAEIAILNSSGIALAADSAVTISEEKVYNSANKLFALSKYEPVGIMVYGKADFMGIPWEIIVKQYRAKLGSRNFSALEEYAGDFWDFLGENDFAKTPQADKPEYLFSFINVYLEMMSDEYKKRAEGKEDSSRHRAESPEFDRNLLLEIIEGAGERINEMKFMPDFNESDVNKIMDRGRNTFERFDDYKLIKSLNEETKRTVYRQAAQLLVRCILLPTSGIVIAGFGTDEILPRIAISEVEGAIDGKIKKVFVDEQSTIQNDEFSASIVPFAQNEMVQLFFDGISPELSEFILKYIESVFRHYPQSIAFEKFGVTEKIAVEIRKRLEMDGKVLFEGLKERLDRFQTSYNTNPILQMVEVLPKDELAAMAETLVNLTAFKRKISREVETVGGPIDVAVISKGDGFIWVKRKHYFKPELNRHFFSNYFREVK